MGRNDRPHWIERQAPAGTPEEARRRRAGGMIGVGILALIVGVVLLASSGRPVGLVVAVLGIGLLVGGLVIRP